MVRDSLVTPTIQKSKSAGNNQCLNRQDFLGISLHIKSAGLRTETVSLLFQEALTPS